MKKNKTEEILEELKDLLIDEEFDSIEANKCSSCCAMSGGGNSGSTTN